MGKHPRKKQKTGKSAREEVQPLGTRPSLTDDSTKDDEERRLESILFGTPFVSSGKDGKNALVVSDDEESGGVVGAGKELENMMDGDVSQCNRQE